MPSLYAGVVVSLSSLFVAGAVHAQSIVRQGVEFQVNQYTTNNQYHPAVASDVDGEFVVSWSSSGRDSPGTAGIFAARFDSAGALIGVEFQVNAYTQGIQHRSSAVARKMARRAKSSISA